MPNDHDNLGDFLDREVYPALFDRLDSAFPEFGWEKVGRRWRATTWPGGFPYQVEHKRPDRLEAFENTPWCVHIHGHESLTWLAYLNHGTQPRGDAFLEATRELCRRAGVDFPERELSEEEKEEARKRGARRAILETTIDHVRKNLAAEGGRAAREYLHGKGLDDDAIADLEVGLYLSREDAQRAMQAAGHTDADVDDAAILWRTLEGYVLFPWRDAAGAPLTLYGKWAGPGKDPGDGRPKTIALPGEGTKASPLYFDRARRAGHRSLVAVEGVTDAAAMVARGDTRVVAYVAAQFSGAQVETLKRYQVESVTIVPDPDGGGDKGALSSVAALTRAGIRSYVAPRLPDGLDPEEFVVRDGIDAWRAHVDAAIPGPVHKGVVALGGVTPDSLPKERREAAGRVLDVVAELHGAAAALDRDDLLALAEERTGYSREALDELADERMAQRRKERRERGLDALYREAQQRRQRGEAPEKVEAYVKGRLEALDDDAKGTGAPITLPTLQRVFDAFLARLEAQARGERAAYLPWPGGREDLPPAFGRIARGALLPPDLGYRGEDWKLLWKLAGPLWPDRLAVLVGSTGRGKSGVALQVAEATARAGHPVLYVSAEMGEDELFARLLTLRARGDDGQHRNGVPYLSVLRGKADLEELTTAGIRLMEDCPNLYLWAPPKAQRTADALESMARAVVDDCGGKPPLVVLDYLQRMADGDDVRQAVREVSGRLRDLSRPGDDWPGAAVLALSSTARGNYEHFNSIDELYLAAEGGWRWGRKAQGGAMRVPVPPIPLEGMGKESGELETDASLLLVFTTDRKFLTEGQGRTDEPRPGLVVVAKNRAGANGHVYMNFWPACGRFKEGSPGDLGIYLEEKREAQKRALEDLKNEPAGEGKAGGDKGKGTRTGGKQRPIPDFSQ